MYEFKEGDRVSHKEIEEDGTVSVSKIGVVVKTVSIDSHMGPPKQEVYVEWQQGDQHWEGLPAAEKFGGLQGGFYDEHSPIYPYNEGDELLID